MKKKVTHRAPLTLSRARALLSPLVREVSESDQAKVPISVRGEVRAYVIGAKRLEALEAREAVGERAHARPPRIEGTLEIAADLEQGSREAALGLELAALRSWDRAQKP